MTKKANLCFVIVLSTSRRTCLDLLFVCMFVCLVGFLFCFLFVCFVPFCLFACLFVCFHFYSVSEKELLRQVWTA